MEQANGDSGYVKVHGGKLYYETAGSGQDVILVHAGFVDRRMWDSQWEALSSRFRVTRYDLRGYGQSEPSKRAVAHRKDLHQLMGELGIERAVLIGCSVGGETVIDFALEHPEMVAALVLVSTVPPGFAMQGEPPRNLLEMIAAAQQGDYDRTSELMMRVWVDGSLREPGDVDARVRQAAAEMTRVPLANGVFDQMFAEPPDPLDPPSVERLGEIHVPTLIVTGSLDNPEIMRAGRFMEGRIHGSRGVLIPDAAHLPNMEKPDEFNQAVLDFLNIELGKTGSPVTH